ncbi:hypothetical protein F4774DRAFT_398685 [Daldinia eschscholtzii]|nr:hypothetical protein F4774DRAFT_398685 [Daldinia eschscholtzii]
MVLARSRRYGNLLLRFARLGYKPICQCSKDERQLEKIIGRMLSQPITPDRSFNIHNKAPCATFAELIAATTPKHYVIGTEILFTGNELAAIESIVMVKGDWGLITREAQVATCAGSRLNRGIQRLRTSEIAEECSDFLERYISIGLQTKTPMLYSLQPVLVLKGEGILLAQTALERTRVQLGSQQILIL